MTKILTSNKNYYDIADTIRQMKNVNTTYKPREMASALKDIYSNEVEGVPPLTFESNGMPLIDYRIDGASGGVGDRTDNLFDYSTVTAGYRITWATGISVADNSAIMSDFIAVSNGIYRANVSVNLIGYDINKNYIGTYDPNSKMFKKDYSSKTTYYDIADNNVKFVKLLSYSATDTISQNTMFYLGSTIPEYEPYGYKVPVVCGGITTNIYLDKPIEAKANIPSEYTEVEYIESTGTQYIDTDYYPNQDTVLKVKYIDVATDEGSTIAFVRWTGHPTYDTFGIFLSGAGLTTIYYGRFSDLDYKRIGNITTIANVNIGIDSVKVNNTTTNITRDQFQSLYPLYLFAGNNTGTVSFYAKCKIYNMIIEENDITKLYLVPCYRKSDGEAGLYDLVNNVFYTNQGTGNFIVGPIKENESISLSDTNVDIPTLEGTNVITIDTTVQPSNIYIQARKDPDEIVDLTTILEEEI